MNSPGKVIFCTFTWFVHYPVLPVVLSIVVCVALMNQSFGSLSHKLEYNNILSVAWPDLALFIAGVIACIDKCPR